MKKIIPYVLSVIFNCIMGRLLMLVFVLLLFSFGDKSGRLGALLIAAVYSTVLIGINFLIYRVFKNSVTAKRYIICAVISFFIVSCFISLFFVTGIHFLL